MKRTLSAVIAIAICLTCFFAEFNFSASATASKITTADELAKRALNVAQNYKTLYVMGGWGAPLNDYNKTRYINNYEYNQSEFQKNAINSASADTFAFDCVCFIKALLWGWDGNTSATNGGAVYESNGVPDIGTEKIIEVCNDVSTDFSNVEIGELLWMQGHVGIYIGNGLSVEATAAWDHKVQISACNTTITGYHTRTWSKHGKLPYVSYHTHSYNNFVCACGAYTNASEKKLSAGDTNYRITSESAKAHTGPYGACPDVNMNLKKNTIITVTHTVTNGHGHTWYKLNNGSYIYGDYVTPFVTISAGVSNPETTKGESNSVTGKIYNAKNSTITAKLDGTQYASFSAGSSSTIDIASSKINSGVSFPSLKAGIHTIVITAKQDGVSTSSTITFSVKEKINYTAIQDGDYRLKNNSNGLYLVADNGNYTNGNNVSTYSLIENATEQIWSFVKESSGYRVTVRGQNYYLNAYGDYGNDGDNITLWENTNHGTQRWNLEKTGSGYIVRNAFNPNNVLTVSGGNNVVLKAYTGSSSQIWTIEPYTPPAEKYYLDVNLTVDDTANNSGLESVTFDVYINDSKVAEDVSDYYAQHTKGQTYTVNDIRVNGCYTNKGNSSYPGTISSTTTVTIPITTYHKPETIPAVAVTCTDIGYTEGTKCATCGMIISQPQPIYPEGHQWDEGVITKEPNFNEEGERTYTCQVCGEKQVDPVPKPQYLPGDINGDGIVNNKDLTRLMKNLAGEDVTVVQAALDINGDKTVNNKDLTRLMKYLAGESVEIY